MMLSIRLTQGRAVDVPCYRVPGVPGLVAHRAYGRPGWRLTHHASGLAVTGGEYLTRAAAFGAGRAVGPLADWADLPVSDRPAMRALGERVAAVLCPWRLSSDAPRSSVVESVLPEGWELLGDDLDGTLVCPHGHYIEFDGACMDGCVSPLRAAGLI